VLEVSLSYDPSDPDEPNGGPRGGGGDEFTFPPPDNSCPSSTPKGEQAPPSQHPRLGADGKVGGETLCLSLWDGDETFDSFELRPAERTELRPTLDYFLPVNARKGPLKKVPGFQVDLICLTPWIDGVPPGPITCLKFSSAYNIMAYGNETGLAIVDLVQKTTLMNLGTPDLYGQADPYQRALKSPRTKNPEDSPLQDQVFPRAGQKPSVSSTTSTAGNSSSWGQRLVRWCLGRNFREEVPNFSSTAVHLTPLRAKADPLCAQKCRSPSEVTRALEALYPADSAGGQKGSDEGTVEQQPLESDVSSPRRPPRKKKSLKHKISKVVKGRGEDSCWWPSSKTVLMSDVVGVPSSASEASRVSRGAESLPPPPTVPSNNRASSTGLDLSPEDREARYHYPFLYADTVVHRLALPRTKSMTRDQQDSDQLVDLDAQREQFLASPRSSLQPAPPSTRPASVASHPAAAASGPNAVARSKSVPHPSGTASSWWNCSMKHVTVDMMGHSVPLHLSDLRDHGKGLKPLVEETPAATVSTLSPRRLSWLTEKKTVPAPLVAPFLVTASSPSTPLSGTPATTPSAKPPTTRSMRLATLQKCASLAFGEAMFDRSSNSAANSAGSSCASSPPASTGSGRRPIRARSLTRSQKHLGGTNRASASSYCVCPPPPPSLPARLCRPRRSSSVVTVVAVVPS
ncbi:unnamed protein product, partial [Cyprideis torosa]